MALTTLVPQESASGLVAVVRDAGNSLQQVPADVTLVPDIEELARPPRGHLRFIGEAGNMRAMRISDYEMNRLRLLKMIRRAEHVARTDLVSLTGLAVGSISQLTADLVRRGVLVEERVASKTVGRPRIHLSINPTAAHAVSVVRLPTDRLAIEIVDLRGDVVFRQEAQLPRIRTLQQWVTLCARSIDKAIKAGPVARRAIARVAVPIPGIVDNQRGIVHWVAMFPERDVPVAALLQAHLKIPVSIDNNTNLLARAEHWFGKDCLDDFSVIMVDQSVTSAHYVDAALWTGSHGINPEMAHTKPGFGDQQPCYCGMQGCLATYCAMFGIVARIARLRGERVPGHRGVARAYRRFATAARQGEPAAAQVFAQAGHLLGLTVANLLNERDPGNVIVMAGDEDFRALASGPFFTALKQNALPVIHARTPVHFRLLDPEQPRKGAAALALEQIYRSG
jgi:predicted NBD/HSP70 family sugar kinase